MQPRMALFTLVVWLMAACVVATPPPPSPVTFTPAASPTARPISSPTLAPSPALSPTPPEIAIGRYTVYERTFEYPAAWYANPWDEAALTVTFTAPSGVVIVVGGFYDGGDTWKVRFAPSEVGRYRWWSQFADASGARTDAGEFMVIESGEHGFVRVYEPNRFHWVLDDGTPYYPIGLQDCTNDRDHSGDPFDDFGFDGGFRPHNLHIGSKIDMDTYLNAYAAAGFNLWRWTAENCGFRLWERIAPEGNLYRQQEAHWGDRLVTTLRAKGFRIYANIFAFDPPFRHETEDSPNLDAVKRYVRYFVNRYAAYVDFWELMNEATASEAWYARVAEAVRDYDPYDHPIATSWERPDLAVMDIVSPHWYQTESEFDSDRVTAERIRSLRPFGKPILFSEHGNSGVNWDERSATRMRLRAWTAFFEQAGLIFWNSSFGKDYAAGAANIYLGPEERGYVRALQAFTAGFDPAAKPVSVVASAPEQVRAYGLRSRDAYAAYLVNFADHANPTSGLRLTADVPVTGAAIWYDPATGERLGTSFISAGQHTLTVPDFVTDIALKITADE
ncbi:MAG TPA: DUF5060 domain-containing protein [Anaerolineales bacterium]|nr:DUF5060 domain-containing protein [Anaerolineales bacterium]